MREAPHRSGGIELLVRRPIEVVVLNCWVTETKDTPCRSNSSTSLAKSANERVRRSTHSIVLTVGPVEIDGDVLAFDEANYFQAVAECGNEMGPRRG